MQSVAVVKYAKELKSYSEIIEPSYCIYRHDKRIILHVKMPNAYTTLIIDVKFMGLIK